jgi:aryl-alcohol dehydrogenase-like predicted oxidoreductase
MRAFEFAKALNLQKQRGWARFITMQHHYNLLAREEEREMIPLCADEGVGTMIWSPLARGPLARPWQAATARSAADPVRRPALHQSDRGQRPRHHRRGRPGGRGPRRHPGADRARLAAP